MLYEYLDPVPKCKGSKPGQYCDPGWDVSPAGSGGMSHLEDGTPGREKFLKSISPTPKKPTPKKKKKK